MTNKQNEAEATITIKAKDEASEEMANITEEAEGMEKGFGMLSKSMIATSLGFLGLSFGVNKAADAVVEARDNTIGLQGQIAVLGPGAEETMRKFEPAIGGIGDIVKESDRTVRETLADILTGSNGIEPTVEDIIGAFALAAEFGIPIEEAANATGNALRGVMDDINAVVDPTGANPVDSLEELWDNITAIFVDSRTSLDEFSALYDTVIDKLTGQDKSPFDQSFFPPVVLPPEDDGIPDLLRAPDSGQEKKRIEDFWAGMAGVLGLDIFDPGSNLFPSMRDSKLRDDLGKPFNGVIDSDLGRTSTVNGGLSIVLNVDPMSDEERKAKMMQQISDAIDELNRRMNANLGTSGVAR